MSGRPSVTIIVLNWNGKKFIDSFFDSIDKQTYPRERMEVLFVDNASSDGSQEYFKSKKVPYARLVQTGANHGYSGGNNYGFREAKGDYVVVCNNDLELAPDWLEILVETADRTKADVVVPKLVFAESKKINNAGSMIHPDKDWPIIERGIDQPADKPEFNEETEVTAFCGASPLFRRSFLREIGLFDKRFFLYWEDGDLSWRGQDKGKKYIYAPKSVAYHYHSGSTGGEQSKTFVYYVSRNRVLILVKHARLRVVCKGFAKVTRDHVVWKIKDLYRAARGGSGRRKALSALVLGLRIVLGILWLTPVMLLKRWHILKEEHL